ncbi:unnamed protein product [Brassica oleracea]
MNIHRPENDETCLKAEWQSPITLSLPMFGFLPLEAVDPLSPSSPALDLREVVASVAPFFASFLSE